MSPRGYTQLVIYLESEEERKKIKEFCRKAGISVSELVREFFRALLSGQGSTIIINNENKIQIGEVNINLQQQNIVQINNNIIAFINLKLRDILEEVNKALKKPSIISYSQALVYTKNQIQKIIEEIRALSPRGHYLKK